MATPNLLHPGSQASLDDLFAYMQYPLVSLEGIIERMDNFTDEEMQLIYEDPNNNGYSNLAALAHIAVGNPSVTHQIIQYLCGMHPKGAANVIRRCIPSGQSVLHFACISPACPFSIIDYITSQCPDVLGVLSGCTGWGLPLHCYVNRAKNLPGEPTIYNLDVDDLVSLVSRYPQALTIRAYESHLRPIDVACMRSDVSSEIVRALIDFPQCTVCRVGIFQNHPLGFLLDSWSGANECISDDKYLEVAKVLIDHTPRNHLLEIFNIACQHKCVSKRLLQIFLNRLPSLAQQMLPFHGIQALPLHVLCANKDCTLDAIRLIHDAYPDGLRARDGIGKLPAFYAAAKHKREVFQYTVAPQVDGVSRPQFSTAEIRDNLLPEACEHGTLDAIKYIVSEYPEILAQPNFSDDLPLHKALKGFTSEEVFEKVEYLLERYPAAASIAGQMNQLPLHVCCASRTTDNGACIALLKAYPFAASARDSYGRLPIHYLSSSYNHTLTILRRVHALNPNGMMQPDNDGLLPLHLHAAYPLSPSLEQLKFLIDAAPDAIKVESPRDGLPVHCVFKQTVSFLGNSRRLETLKILIQRYPDSINFCNENVGLPLNCADDELCFSYLLHHRYANLSMGPTPQYLHRMLRDKKLPKKLQVVGKFLSLFPRQASVQSRQQDYMQQFPLHAAVILTPTLLIDIMCIRKLVKLNPEASRGQDSMGQLPIHNAIQSGCLFEIVEILLGAHPEGCMVPDNASNLPIHLACRYGASLEVVELLVSTAPQCVDMPNNDGCTPLQIACECNATLDVAMRLLCDSKRALGMACLKGDLPLHRACFHGNIQVAELLVMMDQASTAYPSSSRMLPFLLLCQTEGKENDGLFDTAEFVSLAWTVLKAKPDVVKTTSNMLQESDSSDEENTTAQGKNSS